LGTLLAKVKQDNDIGLRPTILWLCHNDILHVVQNDIRRLLAANGKTSCRSRNMVRISLRRSRNIVARTAQYRSARQG
jgi:hypothetical protein